MRHARYVTYNAHPGTLLPVVGNHTGVITEEGMRFFRMRRDASDSKPNSGARLLSSWSSKGTSNLFLQSLSLAILHIPKGLGHLFMVTAVGIRLSAPISGLYVLLPALLETLLSLT